MDIQKKIDRLDDEHIAFRKKVSEYEWDYQDMRREARNVSERMSESILSFCRNNPDSIPTYELHQLEDNREEFERQIRHFEDRLQETYQEENRNYNQSIAELEKEKRKI